MLQSRASSEATPLVAPASASSRSWEAALQRLEGAYSDQTVRSYRSDFRNFADWCRTKRRPFLPATPETAARYLDAIAADLKPATVRRRIAAIRKIHRLARHVDPTDDKTVVLALRRARRSKPGHQRQALGLVGPLRERLLATCDGNLTGLRDAAMLSIGYDTLCRRSELVALRADDIEQRSNGGANILVRRAKNDSDGMGRVASIFAASLSRLRSWLDAAGITEGPLFRPVYGETVKPRYLHPIVVSRVIKAAARRAEIDAEKIEEFSGHLMRVGAAQDLNGRGFDVLTIMRAGGRRSANIVARYIENSGLTIWD